MARYKDYLLEREERGEEAFVEYDTCGVDDYDLTDDANALASVGWGTDEDYFGGDNACDWEF